MVVADFLELKDKFNFLFMVGKSLAVGSKITRHLDLTPYRHAVKTRNIINLRNKIGGLRCLNLSKTKVDDEGLKLWAPHLNKLVNLNLSWTNITDEGLKVLVKECPKLQHLYRQGSYLDKIKAEIEKQEGFINSLFVNDKI